MLRFSTTIISFFCIFSLYPCTSAIVSGELTRDGRPMMWKHRDTGTEHNFITRVEPHDTLMGYIALFNGGDSLLTEAWTGLNDAGFAIMNTASYNLMPDTCKLADREGELMKLALERCRTLSDFEQLLESHPKPMGVQTNFGVIDCNGEAAYYETDDHTFRRFLLADEPSGILFRANYSTCGEEGCGYGYIREKNARQQLAEAIAAKEITPEMFTEKLSCNFYHSLLGHDYTESDEQWLIDQDFIPRRSSAASIVIEGRKPGEPVEAITMWTVLGYPPVSHVVPATINNIPVELQPTEDGMRARACNEAIARKQEVFPLSYGNGSHYIYLPAVKKFASDQRRQSRESYAERRIQRDSKI
ncbi:MAG: hypothetical protein K2M07_08145 [Muribaculaceae bacterium]|nr:hypothetical protein [Muribaculaceae bacterium]